MFGGRSLRMQTCLSRVCWVPPEDRWGCSCRPWSFSGGGTCIYLLYPYLVSKYDGTLVGLGDPTLGVSLVFQHI